MPRTARLEELGLPFHVIVQGIDRCALFVDDYDRTGFILRALRIFREMGVEVLAWSLMDNHVHFVLRATEGRLSKAMQRLLGSYAHGFNRRHGRVGRLFRDRFWSRPVENDDDLLGLIGYVHLNPVRAGIVEDVVSLCSYPWTSVSELVHPPEGRESLVNRVETLVLFGPDARSALEALLAMMAGQLADDPSGAPYARFDPGGSAALSTRERTDLRVPSTHALRLRSSRIDRVLREREALVGIRRLIERRGWDLDAVLVRAAALCRVRADLLRKGKRNHSQSRARGLVAHFAGLYLGSSDAAIARATGIARQSVPKARRRGLAVAEREALSWRDFFQDGGDEGDRTEAKRSSG